MWTSPNPTEALDFDTYEDAWEAAATLNAPLDMLQRVTYGLSGRTVWHVVIPSDGRAMWLAGM